MMDAIHRREGLGHCKTGKLSSAVILAAVGIAATFAAAAALGAAPHPRPDSTFGTSGTVLTDIGATSTSTSATGVAVDSQGRSIAVGGRAEDFVAVRYLEDGGLDPSYGTGGIASIGDWSPLPVPQTAEASTVAIDHEGRAILAGRWTAATGSGPGGKLRCWAYARLNASGALDTTFGPEGTGQVLDCRGGLEIGDVEVTRGGRILLCGFAQGPGVESGRYSVVVKRLLASGRPDPSFGSGRSGRVRLGTSAHQSAGFGLVLGDKGSLLVSGYAGSAAFIAKLTSHGALDKRFGAPGSRGLVSVIEGGPRRCRCTVGWGVVRDPRGRIVSTGFVVPPDGSSFAFVSRLRPSGKPDESFGKHGIVRTQIGSYTTVRHLALQKDGKIVVVGEAGQSLHPKFLALRYKEDGTLDSSFFSRGRLVRKLGRLTSARDLAIDRLGRIVIVGGSALGTTRRFLVSRYLPG